MILSWEIKKKFFFSTVLLIFTPELFYDTRISKYQCSFFLRKAKNWDYKKAFVSYRFYFKLSVSSHPYIWKNQKKLNFLSLHFIGNWLKIPDTVAHLNQATGFFYLPKTSGIQLNVWVIYSLTTYQFLWVANNSCMCSCMCFRGSGGGDSDSPTEQLGNGWR